MGVLTLYAPRTHRGALKALIAAEYVNTKVTHSEDYIMGMSNETENFLGWNLIGKAPVLETPDGPILGGNAVARYIAHGTCYMGSSPEERGFINEWIDFSSFELDSNIKALFFLRIGWATYIKHQEQACILNLTKGFKILDEHLESKELLVGNTVTLADIITTCDLILAFKHLTTESFTSQFPNVERYFWALVKRPQFKKVVGDIKQVEVVFPLRANKQGQPNEAEPIKEGRQAQS